MVAGINRFLIAPIARHTAVEPPDLRAQRSIQTVILCTELKRSELRRVRERDSQTTSTIRQRPDGDLPRCGCSCRSAYAAVTKMVTRWVAAALRRRRGFPCNLRDQQCFPSVSGTRWVPADTGPSTDSSGYWTVKTPRPLQQRAFGAAPSKFLVGAQEVRTQNTPKQSAN